MQNLTQPRPLPLEALKLTKSERREVKKLETYLPHPQGAAIAARSLAALHRAASRRSQEQLENVIGAWGLWGFLEVLDGNGIIPKREG